VMTAAFISLARPHRRSDQPFVTFTGMPSRR
jgi:hypothetical protein